MGYVVGDQDKRSTCRVRRKRSQDAKEHWLARTTRLTNGRRPSVERGSRASGADTTRSSKATATGALDDELDK